MSEAGKQVSRFWDPTKMFDVSAEERRAFEERAKMREGLKREWQKKVTNPHRGQGGYIFDPAMQRYMSMRAQYWNQFKPTPKNFAFYIGACVAPIVLLWYAASSDMENLDQKCRRGEIAYKDRLWKFI